MSNQDFSELEFKAATVEERQTVHPWRRYFARSFDLLLFSSIALVALVIVGYLVAADETDWLIALSTNGWKGMVFSSVLGVLLALPLMAASLSIVGTPGKWLFGVRVRDSEGRRLGIGASFKREILVAVKGMGFGVPVVTAILMIMANLRLQSHGVTTWDQQMRCSVTYASMNVFGYMKAAFGGVVVVAALLFNHFQNVI